MAPLNSAMSVLGEKVNQQPPSVSETEKTSGSPVALSSIGILGTRKRTIMTREEQDNSGIPIRLYDQKYLKIEQIEGKHIVNRPPSQWINYGNPDLWDINVEESIKDAVKGIKSCYLSSTNLIAHFENVRKCIEIIRRPRNYKMFGDRRIVPSFHWTVLNKESKAYGHALERAINIKPDGVNTVFGIVIVEFVG